MDTKADGSGASQTAPVPVFMADAIFSRDQLARMELALGQDWHVPLKGVHLLMLDGLVSQRTGRVLTSPWRMLMSFWVAIPRRGAYGWG